MKTKMAIVSLCLMAASGIGCTAAEVVPDPEPTPAPIEDSTLEKKTDVPVVEGDVPSQDVVSAEQDVVPTEETVVVGDTPVEEAAEAIAQPVETAHPNLPDSDRIYADIMQGCTRASVEESILCLSTNLEVENNRLAGAPYFATGKGTEDGWNRQGQQGGGLILDLDGDGVSTRDDIAFETGFLLDGGEDPTRFLEWVGGNDGLLILDRNGDGEIQPEDLFGQSSVVGLRAGLTVTNAFEDLSLFDSNGDGVINKSDPQFSQLRLWIDCIENRRLNPGEAVTLEEVGIAELRVNYRDTGDETIQQLGTFKSTLAVELEKELDRRLEELEAMQGQ